LLVVTSTIIAGLSYEHEHYDRGIHYMAANTIEALSLVQGLCRVRQLSNPNIEVYLGNVDKLKGAYTPAGIITEGISRAAHRQVNHSLRDQLLNVYVKARVNCLFAFNTQLLCTFLSSQGYRIEQVKVKAKVQDQTPVTSGLHQTLITEDELITIPKLPEAVINAMRDDEARLIKSKQTICKVAQLLDATAPQVNELVHQFQLDTLSSHFKELAQALRIQRLKTHFNTENLAERRDEVIKQLKTLYTNDERLRQLNVLHFDKGQTTLERLVDAQILHAEIKDVVHEADKVQAAFARRGWKQGI
jgi:hypothetical protein